MMSQQNQTPKISIILPTYNEAGNIELLMDRTLQALGNYPGGLEIVVVDDNSPDGTWHLVARKAEQDARIRLIHRRNENGLTSAISRGLTEGRGEWLGWMDCDLSMPPEQWPQLAQALAQGADMAVGSRYVPGGGDVAHSLTGRLFSRLIHIWSGIILS